MSPAEPNEAPAGAAGEDLDFDPVVNGVDFLDSAITNLLTSHDPRSLKYAVLHLQAAIEILVKVRLQREGIEHIFEDPYSADENKLRQGQFRSVTLTAALKRLNKVASIQLTTSEEKALQYLNEERNKLQHFGSTSKHEVVNTRAAKALDVLSQFILQHLVPGAPEHEAGPLEETEDLIRRALTDIAAVTQARLTRLEPELDSWTGIVIHCPDCRQLTWTFQPHDESSGAGFAAETGIRRTAWKRRRSTSGASSANHDTRQPRAELPGRSACAPSAIRKPSSPSPPVRNQTASSHRSASTAASSPPSQPALAADAGERPATPTT